MKKFLLASLLFSTVACGRDAVEPFVPVATAISITPPAAQLEIGRSITMATTVKDQNGDVMTAPITWSSTSPNVATITSAGLVTGVSRGQTVIRAVTGEISATVPVFVIDPTVATVSVSGLPTSTFFVGQSFQANATVRDVAGNVLNAFAVTWTSSTPGVASVSSTGLVVGVSAGTTTLTASAGGKSASATVTVTLVPVNSVSLSSTKPVQIGRDVTLTTTLRNATGGTLPLTQRSLVWASTDTSVATVVNGVVRGVSAGTATITLVVEGKVGLLTVIVAEVEIDHIIVTPDSAEVQIGSTRQFVAEAFDADSVALTVPALNGRVFVWTSSNNRKFAVSNSGLVTAIDTVRGTVTATIGSKSGTADVIVVP